MGIMKKPLIVFLGDMPMEYVESSVNEWISTEIKAVGTINGQSIIIYSIRKSP